MTIDRGTEQSFTSLMAEAPSRHTTEFIHLSGTLMEYFHEGIVLLRQWYINPNEKSNNTNPFTRVIIQGNVPLRHLLHAKPLLMS